MEIKFLLQILIIYSIVLEGKVFQNSGLLINYFEKPFFK